MHYQSLLCRMHPGKEASRAYLDQRNEQDEPSI